MADFPAAFGGRYASPSQWQQAAAQLGFRVEFAPDLDAAVVGGHLWGRIAHPAFASGRDLFFETDVQIHVPARDAPAAVLAHWRESLEMLIALEAPAIEVLHCTMVVGWLEGGQPGLERAVRQFIEREIAGGVDEDVLDNHRTVHERAKRPDARMDQVLLFRPMGERASSYVAHRVLAASYALASGGEYREVMHGPVAAADIAEPEVLRGILFRDLDGMRGNEFEPEVIFQTWDAHRPEDPESDEHEG